MAAQHTTAATAVDFLRERGLSRSELYATALRDYLQVHGDAALTKRFDAVYAQQESRLDPPLALAQQRGIADEAW